MRQLLLSLLLLDVVFASQQEKPICFLKGKWASWQQGNTNPDTAIPDDEYFRFTQENIDASKVDIFYSEWTIERQSAPEWKEIGEWRLFSSDFRHSPHYQSDTNNEHWMTKPSLPHLQRIWPGEQNRALVRRIYFVLKKWEYLHAHTEELLEMLRITQAGIVKIAPDLVFSFTKEEAERSQQNCDIVKAILQQPINAAISVAAAMIGGAFSSVGSAGKQITLSNPSFGTLDPEAVRLAQNITISTVTENAATIFEKQNLEKRLRIAMGKGVKEVQYLIHNTWADAGVNIPRRSLSEYRLNLEKARPKSYNWFDLVWRRTFNKRTWRPLVSNGEHHWSDLLTFDGDMRSQALCHQLNHVFVNNNKKNMRKLKLALTRITKQIHEHIRRVFTTIFEGVIIEPGQPTLVARMMSNRIWVDEDSTTGAAENLQMAVAKTMIKNLVSYLLSRNVNYLKCTHHPQAAEMCRDAQTNDASAISRSRFCPEPNDPTLICQLGKWDFSNDTHQHEVEMSGLSKIETLFNNRYGFTLEEFKKEIWESYKICGNDCAETDWQRVPFAGSVNAKWKVPTCVSNGVHITDFTIDAEKPDNQNAYAFPSVCGDFAASDTEAFMQAMHLPQRTYFGAHNESLIWTDRIPRELDSLPPFQNYIALCRQRVRFPRHDEEVDSQHSPNPSMVGESTWQKYYHYGGDANCHNVTREVVRLDLDSEEYFANRWFCLSELGRAIQTSQRGYVDLPSIPHTRVPSHRERCASWQRGGSSS